jgi:uncharacterized protein YjbI with pentapeptide repeats
MANDDHVAQLMKGVVAWNAWRKENHVTHPDLSGADLRRADLSGAHLSKADLSWARLSNAYLKEADLSEADLVGTNIRGANLSEANLSGANLRKAGLCGAHLSGADLSGADLSGADLSGADLRRADLSGAHLSGAHLRKANLSGAHLSKADLSWAHLSKANFNGAHLRKADLSGADLRRANLSGANLSGAHLSDANLTGANLTGANLRGADLTGALLVGTNLTGADLTGCRVYGISAWNLKLEGAKQQDLVITPDDEPAITVDNIQVAQFVYLLLDNQNIRHVIDTVTSKVVLILGRFTADRKAVLDALRNELRERDYVPILFDFEIPARRNITETVTLLARMARFIIADLTDPSSIPQELQAIIPSVRVPVQPLLLEGSSLYSMFPDFEDYPWVLPEYRYKQPEQLLAALAENVIAPAEGKVKAMEERRHKIEAELNKTP